MIEETPFTAKKTFGDFDREAVIRRRLAQNEAAEAFDQTARAKLLALSESPAPSIAALDQIQDYRFGSMMKGEHYAFARGLTINPTHLPAALDAMEKDGWKLVAIFGQTDAQNIGFIFKRHDPEVTEQSTAVSHALTAALENVEKLERRVKDLLHANTMLVNRYREVRDERDQLRNR